MKGSSVIFLTLIFAFSACAPATTIEELPPTARSTGIPTTLSVSPPGPSPTPPTGPGLLPTISLRPLPTSDGAALPAQGASPLPTFDITSIPTLAPATLWPSAIPLPTQPPYFGSPDPDADCFATASGGGLRLNPGPFVSANQLLPRMEPGVRYRVIDKFQTFFQFAREGVPVGWIEFPIYNSGYVTEGAGCAAFFERPYDARSIASFPGLCFFTIDRPTQMFSDSALTQPTFGFEGSSGPFVVLWKSRKSIFTSLGHAGPSFYSPTDNVRIFGDCDGIPTSAAVTTAGWLWSEPDESQGEMLLRLTVGMHLHIEGKRPPDTSGQAAWVQALAETQGESTSGWVWSGLVAFD